MINACNANTSLEPTPILASTNTSLPTGSPTQSPTDTLVPENVLPLTVVVCPPFPLLQELPLPNHVEEFIGRYVQIPGRTKGIEFHSYVPIGFEVYSDSNGELKTRDKGYIIADPSMGNKDMLWLEKEICSTPGTNSSPQSYTFYQVVDVVELPIMGKDHVVDLNTCLIHDSLQPHVIGLGEMNNGSGKLSEPLYAWEISLQDETLIPIETKNIKCDFDMSYPKP